MSFSPAIQNAASLLRRWGVTVRVHPNAASNGRDFDFAPVGVVAHHTASRASSSTTASRNVVLNGRTGIPGPLAQIFVPRDGSVDFLSFGRANHAGLGGPWRTVPKNSGNRYLVGVEVDNDGVRELYPAEQLRTARLTYAALLISLKRDESWLLGHKEWAPGRKIDPLLNMSVERRYVAELIAEKTKPSDGRHVVQRGETLTSIAQDFGTTVAILAKLNNIRDADVIAVGQPLTIPAPRYYTVQAGDTLYRIAARENTTVEDLVRLNKLTNPDALQVGQRLRLPI